MPNLKYTNEKGQTFELTDVSIEDFAKLAGLNGHSKNGASVVAPLFVASQSVNHVSSRQPNYPEFKRRLTKKAKEFLQILSQNPNGINADHLASQLGFQSGVQLGGMAGGGLAKHAVEYDVDLSYVYTREKRSVNGARQIIYKPGADISSLL